MLNHGYERRNKHRNHKLLTKPLPKSDIKISVPKKVNKPVEKPVHPLPESTYEQYPKPHVEDMKVFDETLDELIEDRKSFYQNEAPQTRVQRDTRMVSLEDVLEPSERLNHNLGFFTLILLGVFAALLVVLLAFVAVTPSGTITRISSAGLLAYAVFASAAMAFVLLTPTIWFMNVWYQVYISRQWHKTNDTIPYRSATEYLYTTMLTFFIIAGTSILGGLVVMILAQVNPTLMSLSTSSYAYVDVLTYLLYTSGVIFTWLGIVGHFTYHSVKS